MYKVHSFAMAFNYNILNSLRLNYLRLKTCLPKTHIRPVLMSLFTTILLFAVLGCTYNIGKQCGSLSSLYKHNELICSYANLHFNAVDTGKCTYTLHIYVTRFAKRVLYAHSFKSPVLVITI